MLNEQNYEKSDDIFSTFLVKEKELEYVEKIHAQAGVMKMARDYQERENSATFITRIKDFFQDCKDTRTLKKVVKEAESKMASLSDEEKCDKEIDHKGYKHGNFKTHIIFEQKYTERNIIADCGGFHYPVIEYHVYMRVELTPMEIWTKKYLEKRFDSYEDAETYYNELRRKYKNMKSEEVLRQLTKKIDNHCDELKEEMKTFNIE